MSWRYGDHPRFNCKSPWLNYSAGIVKDTDSRALSVEILRKIIRYDGELKYPLAKDLFLISLFFCGINMADIFYLARIKAGRLEYNRVKTRRGRSDDAFSSILIQPEAKYLINKYVKDNRFIFPGYTNPHSFYYVLRVGLDDLVEKIGVNETLIYYTARHLVATIIGMIWRFRIVILKGP
ncbi:MAG: hypothetical protein RR303_07575 [Bacteroidales bacterium]